MTYWKQYGWKITVVSWLILTINYGALITINLYGTFHISVRLFALLCLMWVDRIHSKVIRLFLFICDETNEILDRKEKIKYVVFNYVLSIVLPLLYYFVLDIYCISVHCKWQTETRILLFGIGIVTLLLTRYVKKSIAYFDNYQPLNSVV